MSQAINDRNSEQPNKASLTIATKNKNKFN